MIKDGAFFSRLSPSTILSSYLPVKTRFAPAFNLPENFGPLHPLSQQFECKVNILISGFQQYPCRVGIAHH
jgi:hypothetical protein